MILDPAPGWGLHSCRKVIWFFLYLLLLLIKSTHQVLDFCDSIDIIPHVSSLIPLYCYCWILYKMERDALVSFINRLLIPGRLIKPVRVFVLIKCTPKAKSRTSMFELFKNMDLRVHVANHLTSASNLDVVKWKVNIDTLALLERSNSKLWKHRGRY